MCGGGGYVGCLCEEESESFGRDGGVRKGEERMRGGGGVEIEVGKHRYKKCGGMEM